MTKERSKAPRDHTGRFERLAVPRNTVDRAIRLLAPDDRPATLVSLFNNRAGYHTIRGWRKRGRAPRWAVELLQTKTAAWRAAVDAIEIGPGPSAGWRNVKGYQLNMQR